MKWQNLLDFSANLRSGYVSKICSISAVNLLSDHGSRICSISAVYLLSDRTAQTLLDFCCQSGVRPWQQNLLGFCHQSADCCQTMATGSARKAIAYCGRRWYLICRQDLLESAANLLVYRGQLSFWDINLFTRSFDSFKQSVLNIMNSNLKVTA